MANDGQLLSDATKYAKCTNGRMAGKEQFLKGTVIFKGWQVLFKILNCSSPLAALSAVNTSSSTVLGDEMLKCHSSIFLFKSCLCEKSISRN